MILPFNSFLLYWMFTCSMCSCVIQHNCACLDVSAIKTVKMWKVLAETPTHATSWALIQELQLHSVSCSSLSCGGGVLALHFSLPSWLVILAWPHACLFITHLSLNSAVNWIWLLNPFFLFSWGIVRERLHPEGEDTAFPAWLSPVAPGFHSLIDQSAVSWQNPSG